MKQFILFSVALVGLTACRNDDDNKTPETEASIIGVWQPVKYITYDGKTNAVLSNDEVDVCGVKDRYEFTIDGKATAELYEPNTNNQCELVATDKGNYTYNSRTKAIYFVFDNEKKEEKVIKLTNEELEITRYSSDVNNDGVADTHTTLFKRIK